MAKASKPKTIKHIVTEQDLIDNPELVEQGVKVDDEIEIPEPAKEKKDPELVKKMAPYVKAYPNEKVFHITTDGQVFLNENKAFAKEHQLFLNKGVNAEGLEVYEA